MSDSHFEFDRRLRRLNRKNRAMTRGYTTRMRPDGLIVLQPRSTAPRIQPRTIVFFLVACLAFKGFLIAAVGPVSYEQRVANLAQGTSVEKAGAWVMQIDPASQWISEKVAPYLR